MDHLRQSGILLHPTSLPGRYGIGTFNDTAYEWVDFLAATHQSLWQVLPLGPLKLACWHPTYYRRFPVRLRYARHPTRDHQQAPSYLPERLS